MRGDGGTKLNLMTVAASISGVDLMITMTEVIINTGVIILSSIVQNGDQYMIN